MCHRVLFDLLPFDVCLFFSACDRWCCLPALNLVEADSSEFHSRQLSKLLHIFERFLRPGQEKKKKKSNKKKAVKKKPKKTHQSKVHAVSMALVVLTKCHMKARLLHCNISFLVFFYVNHITLKAADMFNRREERHKHIGHVCYTCWLTREGVVYLQLPCTVKAHVLTEKQQHINSYCSGLRSDLAQTNAKLFFFFFFF